MTRSEWIRWLVLVAITLGLIAPKGSGAFFVAGLPLFVAWALYSAVQIAMKPTERRTRAIQLALVGATMSIGLAAQLYWGKAWRDSADSAAAAIRAHRAKTGAWPASLRDAGLDEDALRRDWEIDYRLRDGQARLSYPATLMAMTTYEYDFDKQQWVTNAY